MENRRGRRLVPRSAIVLGGIVVGFALVAGVLVAARATDSSAFCKTCHEMVPYHQAWAAGPHSRVECVECHVAQGTLNRLAHKFVALGEVRAHLFGDPKFPVGGVGVPNDRCRRCHPKVDVPTPAISRFSHALHTQKARCWECHSDTGHRVTLESLSKAGVLAPNAKEVPAAVAGVQGGKPIPGHKPTSCLRCHDQSKMACATCHKPPHKDRGDCKLCHRPGAAFAFYHPTTGDCAACHKPKHQPRGQCTLCHRVGKTWTFFHPTSQDCAKCHKPKHGPRGACSQCHRVGKTWAFFHPKSKACTGCHQAPANHFGTDCARCHTPSRPWTDASFAHPSTGAPHSYRAFACRNCHPSGPPAVSCTCHGGGRPSGD